MTYPQQPQQPYTPPAPAPKKKNKAAGCFGIGCGGLVLLVVIGGIASALGGTKTTPTATTVAGPAASTIAAAPVKAEPTKAAPAPVAAKPKVLLKLSGNGIKNTTHFITGDDWTINYTYDCSKSGLDQGNFSIYVDYPNGDIPVNELGRKGASSSTSSGSGKHTLKIASECAWTISVIDG